MAVTLTGCIVVAAGGAAGCLCRYLVQQLPVMAADKSLPTLTVNVLGCLLIGFAAALFDDHRATLGLPAGLRLLIVTGFLGGFTTYSTFTLDAATMMRGGEMLKAFGYLAVTVVGGFAAYFAGLWAAHRVIS